MSDKDYAPSYQVHAKRGTKQAKTLFMAPVFVKRHEAHEAHEKDLGHAHVQRPTQSGGDAQREPTKETPSACRKILHLSAPKESFTQTSKTILQLAQLEHARVQAIREDTLDLRPELEQRLSGKLEKIELEEFEEKFSVDSLNLREEPVKEARAPKVARDLQDFIELKAVTNLRLAQWMSTINEHASSLTDFQAEPSASRRCGALLTPTSCKHHVGGEPRMTSFHNFIDVQEAAPSAASSKAQLPEEPRSEQTDEAQAKRAHASTASSESHPAPTHRARRRSKSLVDKQGCARAPFTNSKEDQSLKVAVVREPVLKTMRSSSLLNAMSVKHLKKADNASGSTFMFPTLSSEKKSLKQQVESVRWLVGSKFAAAASPKGGARKKRGRSPAAAAATKPRAVRSEDLGKRGSLARANAEKLAAALSSSTLFGSNGSCDHGFFLLLNLVKSADFSASLKGLAEIIDTAKHTSREVMMPYMTLINQRLLQLLKSPRSHVARTACQLTGHFFEVMKDTRRPEFDDIVNTLLFKTADTSKFIRTDANMALDAMVTHIPVFHAVRSLCAKGPTHRNPLVRCAAARLIICAVVIAAPSAVMTCANLETTRKRIFENLVHFLDDKNVDTRKYAERLYVTLANGGTFDLYARKYLNPTKYEALIAFGSKLSERFE